MKWWLKFSWIRYLDIGNTVSLKEDEPKETLIKMAKVKERILKAAGEKQRLTYKGTPSGAQAIRLSDDCSVETLQATVSWHI